MANKKKIGRKGLRLTPSELALLKAYAAKEKLTVTEVVHRWVRDFLKNGTDAEPKVENPVLNLKVDVELFEAAEREARVGYGVTLNDVIHHEIARLR